MRHTGNGQRHHWESTKPRADYASCREQSEQLESALAGFRRAVRTAADRPEYFWDRQRLAVRHRMQLAPCVSRSRTVWIWASATAVVILALTIFVPRGEPVVPDIAVGQDQELLLSVERSLNREMPESLEPALLLTAELENAASHSTKK